jgi:phasin family protein
MGSSSEAFSKMFKDMKMPKVDFEAVIKAHKKNLETLTKAQKSCFDCAKSLGEAQSNYLKQSFEDMRSHWQDMMSSKSLEEKVQAHTERLKDFFEKTMNHGRLMSEQLMKSHHDISTIVQERFTEGMNEAKDMMKKATPSKH